MDIRESLALSLVGLSAHKLRSFLTMLGIIFGVAAVIAMLSIGAGAKQEALEQIRLMGLKNIILQSQPVTTEEDEIGTVIRARGLTQADARALLTLNPLVTASVPQKELTETRIARGSANLTTTVVGTTPAFPVILDLTPAKGNFFNYQDLHEARRICVLGHSVKRRLFAFEEAVGEQVKIGDLWFTVAGVLYPVPRVSGKGGVGERDMNLDVYVPLSSALHRFEQDLAAPELDQVILQVADEERVREAANLARALLDLRHNHAADVKIIIPEALLRQSQKTQRVFNIVMGAIAGISLVVGGIGIMNIMLATVLERTREIGIRRAVGATRRDISVQFLIESSLLSLSGGLVGILLGFLMTLGIASYAHWKTIVELTSILLAFCVSVGVGVVFGIYPARKAAWLNPIESLRHE